MKKLAYKGDSDIRSFDAETLKRLNIDEDDELIFDKTQNGGVLELKNASAEKLMELYDNDFVEVSNEEAEQLELQAQAPPTDPAPIAPDANDKSGKKA